MAEPLYQRLWAGQDWPMTDDDHEFLVPAFQRIGRAVAGSRWDDRFPTLNLWPQKPATVEEASEEDRLIAHIFMRSHFADTYVEDWEPAPPPPFRTLGDLSPALGLGSSTALGAVNTPSLGPNGRAPGYWFKPYDWSAFLAKLHADNEGFKVGIAIANEAARWLFNQIVRGAITPLVQPRNGGALTPTVEGDWRMNTAERLRLRIQNCAMVPGRPDVVNGSHWIILKKVEVDAALAQLTSGTDTEKLDARNGLEVEVTSDAAPLPGSDLSYLDNLAAKQTYWRENSEAIIRDALAFAADSGEATRKRSLTHHILSKWPRLTDSWVSEKVWPKVVAEYPSLSTPGNRMGSKRASRGSLIKKEASG